MSSTAETMTAGLEAAGLRLSYGAAPVISEIDARIEPGLFTVIVGPNACGKSTLLRAFGRVLQAEAGEVTLGGAPVEQYGTKEFARRVGLLPQSAIAPDGITVGDLVSRGRFPHQGLWRQWSAEDGAAVAAALARTHTAHLAERPVGELSGGQRQRVWIAMALAQQTDHLLLDEPTTYLDLAHQLEVLDLCAQMRDEHGTTVVAVLHDLNQAARYADRMLVMKSGALIASGTPHEVVTAEVVHEAFDVPCIVIDDPETRTPLVVPRAPRTSR